MKKIYFGIILGLMVLGGVGIFASGQKQFSENENRYLNTLDHIKGPEQVEEVMVDQFALRDLWLTVNSSVQYATGAREINDTYIGLDGYLFDACASWDFDRTSYANNLQYVRIFAEKYGANMDVMLVPSPYVIMEDMLPREANVYEAKEAFETAQKSLQFMSLVGEESEDVQNVHFIDLRDCLKELSQTAQVYYRTDHHWTTVAARAAYYELGGQTPKEELKLVPVTNAFRGTMYSRVQLPNAAQDTIYALEEALSYEQNTADAAVLYDEGKLEQKDKYAFFLGGNSARVDYHGEGEGHLLVIKDSFANCMIPFLLKDYETVTVIDLRFYNASIAELMDEEFEQVLVLYEMSNFAADTNIFKLAR